MRMRNVPRFFLMAAVTAASCWHLSAQEVKFRTIPKEVVEGRLRDCPEKSAQRWRKLEEWFKAAGGGDSLSEQPVSGYPDPNVICTLRGESDSTIIVGAHFDNGGWGHGVIDNWSGAALLPTLYESLKVVPRKHTFIFVGFAAEEEGLKGSSFYARHMTREEVARTRALVNLDCLGLGTTAVLTLSSDKMLMDMLVRVAGALKLRLGMGNLQGARWDADSFSGKIPKITLHSITVRKGNVANSFSDNWDEVRWDEYYNSYLLAAAYLAHIDGQLKEERAPSRFAERASGQAQPAFFK